MSCDFLKVVTCGSPQRIADAELRIPVDRKIIYNADEIASFIDRHSPLVLFIILFLDLSHTNIDLILTALSNRNNVIAIFICDNTIHNSSNNQPNVLRISPHLVTNEITFRAIFAYESIYEKLLKSGPEKFALVSEKQAKDLKQWYTTNNKVKLCHILINPVNVADSILTDFQQNLIDFCKRLYPNREIIVCTTYDFIAYEEINLSDDIAFGNSGFDDYIAFEESKLDDYHASNDPHFKFRYEQRKIICHLLKESVPIRIHLLGNEDRIKNKWSKLLNAIDFKDDHNNRFEYITFMESEPVTDITKSKIPGLLGCKREGQKVDYKRLENIEEDKDFHSVLVYADDTRETRESTINADLCLQTTSYHDNSIYHSSAFRLTGQSQEVLMNQDENSNEAMDISMQSNYLELPSN